MKRREKQVNGIQVKKKKEKMMYFPNLKKSLKSGGIVFGTCVAVSGVIVGINYGMSWLLSLI